MAAKIATRNTKRFMVPSLSAVAEVTTPSLLRVFALRGGRDGTRGTQSACPMLAAVIGGCR
ncbi:MAG: hypothetical protein HY914_11525 [Desulfomonile tiedjei]|nr:hypothetical protein [Desulfomonile tiedjei]